MTSEGERAWVWRAPCVGSWWIFVFQYGKSFAWFQPSSVGHPLTLQQERNISGIFTTCTGYTMFYSTCWQHSGVGQKFSSIGGEGKRGKGLPMCQNCRLSNPVGWSTVVESGPDSWLTINELRTSTSCSSQLNKQFFVWKKSSSMR